MKTTTDRPFIKEEILAAGRCGFEFEFYSKQNLSAAAKSIEKTIGKKIEIPKKIVGLNKQEVGVHSDFTPTDLVFKLEKDYSGGSELMELITGPLEFPEAKIILNRILAWIKDFGSTTKRCGIHLNLSLNYEKIPKIPGKIQNIPPLKLCLAYDEEEIFSRFPERKGNVYAQTIKQIFPTNRFSYVADITNVVFDRYLTPSKKYYGINFLKQEKDYLEIRYLGGEDYEKKGREIIEIMDYSLIKIAECIYQPEIKPKEFSDLKALLKKYDKSVKSFYDLERFILNYKDITLSVDLKSDEQILKTFWPHIKDTLFNLVVLGGMTTGHLNYDADFGKYQLKDSKLTNSLDIKDLEIFNTYLNGMFQNCEFFDCEIQSAHLDGCKLTDGNLVKDSKILDTPIHINNKVLNCYISNKKSVINGTIENSIIRDGEPGTMAKLINTKIVKE